MSQPPETFTEESGRWIILSTVLASSMAFIDGSALNVALPSLQTDLGATGSELLWILNGYMVMLASLILIGGSLGDHFGRKRVYMIGIGIFATASFLCGIAPNTDLLIIGRVAQGLGGALMIPGSLSLISALFDDNSRGKAIGTWSAFTTIASVLGPVLGGVFSDIGFWRGIFFINIPFALISIYVLYTRVPESYDEDVASEQLDFVGSILVTLGLAGIAYGFIQGPETGWDNSLIILALVGGFAMLIIFALWERRTANPMMPLSLFNSSTFTGTNLMTFFLYGALAGVLLFFPINLVQVQGYRQAVAGLAMLPFSAFLALMSRRMGAVVDRYGPRIPLTVGPIIVGIGFILLSLPGITNGVSDYWTTYFPAALVLGIGMGTTVAPLTTAVMGSVAQKRSGVASGVNNAISRSSQVFAVAILGAVALVSFNENLLNEIETLNLPNETVSYLEEESEKLADASPPEDLDQDTQANVNKAIDNAFIDTFRLISYIGAGLCWMSAFLAWLFVRKDLTAPRRT